MQADSPKSPEPEKRKRKWKLWPRRWAARALVLIFLLLFVVVVATQIILSTNIPRDLVLGQLEKQLGLRVSAASMSTGWLGHTDLKDVTIALPLSNETLLRVPEMRVRHNSLFGLLVTQAVSLEAIELNRPDLVVRQDDSGRWNLQQVAELLARTGGKQAAADTQNFSRPRLPAVRVRDGVVRVIDRAAHMTVIQPVVVVGDPEGGLAWKYEVSAGDEMLSGDSPGVHLTGRLAPGPLWEHDVDIQARRVGAWAAPLVGKNVPAVSLTGRWHGQAREGGVFGRLVLAALDVADVHTTGALGIDSENGTVTLHPESIVVQTPQESVPDVWLTGGGVVLDGKSATAQKLTVSAFDSTAHVDGRYDWAAGSADLNAVWAALATSNQKLPRSGSLTASLRSPLTGRTIEAHLISNGKLPSGGWIADLALHGAGRSFGEMDWQLDAKHLTLDFALQPVLLDGLAATLQTRGKLLSVTNVRGPGEVAAKGRGQFDFGSREWNLRVDLSNLPHPAAFADQAPQAITLNAHGTSERIVLENPGLSLRGSDAELRLDGAYVYRDPKPLNVTLNVNHLPRRPGSAVDDGTPTVFGYLHGEAKVVGTLLHPTNLSISGHLAGREVRLLNRPIGEFEAALSGEANDDRLTVRFQQMQLLGGQWKIDALFPDHGVLGVNVNVSGLSLDKLGVAFNEPTLGGVIDARWAFIIPRLSAEAVKMTGEVKGRELKHGKLAADSMEATVVLADGELNINPVLLRKDKGEARVAAALDVRKFRQLSASLDLSSWPFEPKPGTKAELSGGTSGVRIILPGAVREEGIRRGVFRLQSRAERVWVTGPIDLRAAFTLKDQPLGDARLLADLRGRSLDLRSLEFDGLDGTVQGQAVVNFDRPFETRGSLHFEDFNAARLPEFFPENQALPGLAGRFSGGVHIGPAPGPRPIEPLLIKGNVSNVGGKYRSIEVGPIQFSAFTNLDRFVIEDMVETPTILELAGGLVRVWGRFSALEAGDELNPTAGKSIFLSQMQVSFGRLDLNQIVHAFKPDSEPMVGRLSGSFAALASTHSGRRPGAAPSGQPMIERVVRRITADGRVEVTDSDLVNLDVVAAMYDAMSISAWPTDPVGRGELTFHLEDGQLGLNNVRYFNRGTEIRAIADVDQIWRMPASPVEGIVVGTARPFRDIKLPFLSTYDLDTLFTALQTDLTTVGLSGAVNAPVVEGLAFSDISNGMRMLILGDYEKEKRKSRPR